MTGDRIAAGVLTVALGLAACTTLIRAINQPTPGRVAAAAVCLVAHCAWALVGIALYR